MTNAHKFYVIKGHMITWCQVERQTAPTLTEVYDRMERIWPKEYKGFDNWERQAIWLACNDLFISEPVCVPQPNDHDDIPF